MAAAVLPSTSQHEQADGEEVQMTRSLAFVDAELEQAYTEISAQQNLFLARSFAALVSFVLGVWILIAIFVLGRSLTSLWEIFAVWLTCFLCGGFALITRTKFGRRHWIILAATLVCFTTSGTAVLNSQELIRISLPLNSEEMREPYEGSIVPACSTVKTNNSSGRPIDLNYTDAATIKGYALHSIYFTGQVCYHVTNDNEVMVVETRIWKAKNYDAIYFQLNCYRKLLDGTLYGTGAVLLMSMRCVHAVVGVALPLLAYWIVIAARTSAGSSIGILVILVMPALAIFIGMSWKVERRDRLLFIERRKVQRMLDEQHRELRRKSRELRRKSATIKTTKSKNAEMMARLDSAKFQLASKTLDSRLGARPPAPFTLDEFQDEYEARGGRNSALIDAVASVCSEWVFVSPIDDAKWSYFTTYIVPLPFWKETEHFARLQDIANAANAAITFHVTRMLEQISQDADGEHGIWLLDELDHINAGKRIADLSAWVEPKLLGAAEVLSTPAAKQEYEIEVMPAVVRALANMLFESFKSKLAALSPDVHDEDEENHEAEEGSPIFRRNSTYSKLELPIDSDGQSDPIALRCSREKSVKGAKRMGAKVAEAHAKGVPFPAINNIGDALRASLSTATCEGVRECWRLVKQNFEVIRMKNKFKDAIAELRSGGDLRTVSPNLHINCLFRHTMDGVERCIVVELQIYAKAILETKREAHKIYDVTRAKSIDDLLTT